MSCETRTDSAGRGSPLPRSLPEKAPLSMRATQISHRFHLTHSAARACPCPSGRRPGYHIIAGSEVNGSGRCFILARSPSSAAVLHGWMARPLLPARSGALDGLSAPPSSAFRATNYHTFGSDSGVRPLWGHAQNARSAKTYSIYRSNYKGSLAFYCAHCCVSHTE